MVYNPYANVDWESITLVPSTSHMHNTSQAAFENAYNGGLRHFPITRYNPPLTYYPLEDFFDPVPSDAIGCPNTELTVADSPLHYTHPGSMYDSTMYDNPQPWRESFERSIAEMIYPGGGGIILAHPVYTGLSVEQQAEMLDYADEVIGIEAVSHQAYIGYDRPLMDSYMTATLNNWDRLLSTGRKVIGSFVPDHRAKTGDWWGRNILLVNNATEQDCAESYRIGSFYGSLEGRLDYLGFEEIAATDNQIVVKLNTSASISFITDKGESLTISGGEGSYNLLGNEIFVRVEAVKGTERIFSQAIMYKNKEEVEKKRKMRMFIAGIM